MPVIRLDFDDTKVNEEEVIQLSEIIRKIVIEVTGIEDVFVYANSAQIKIAIAPIEIFIEMSAHKIKDENLLVSEIKRKLIEWKQETQFSHKINFSFIPMNWKIEIGI